MSELPPRPKLMMCGCAPHATHRKEDGTYEWCCFVHAFGGPLSEAAMTPMPEDQIPDLTGRRARCTYHGWPTQGWHRRHGLRALPREDGSYILRTNRPGGTYRLRQKIARAGCTWHKRKTEMGVGHWT